jgi:cap1 methyltransferase
LKGKDDFKLEKFNKESPHDNFELCYGVDGTGDLTSNENILNFSEVIDKGTNGRGVALLTANGGFSVQGVENQQEGLLRQLVLCQFTTALQVLRKGGNFMCKVFDLFSDFNVGLCYILYQNFESFGILKPISSRPANSERYIICKNLKARKPAVVKYLLEVNSKLAQKQNVVSVVDADVLNADQEFIDYIITSNILIGQKQVKFLQKIKQAVEDQYMDIKKNQQDVRKRCLEHWGLPISTPNSYNYSQQRPPSTYHNQRREERPNYQRRDDWGNNSKPSYHSKPLQYRAVSSGSKRPRDELIKTKEEQQEEIRKRHKNSENWIETDQKKVSYVAFEPSKDSEQDSNQDDAKNVDDLEKAYFQ